MVVCSLATAQLPLVTPEAQEQMTETREECSLMSHWPEEGSVPDLAYVEVWWTWWLALSHVLAKLHSTVRVGLDAPSCWPHLLKQFSKTPLRQLARSQCVSSSMVA